MLAAQRAMGAYAKVELETSIGSASPHQLIQMLFDGARASLAQARHALERGLGQDKNRAIARALTIITEGLRGSLDIARGGDIALNLDALYAYMEGELVMANLHSDAQRISTVDELLAGLQSAWQDIGRPGSTSAPEAA
jgi:flagellar protein FliS